VNQVEQETARNISDVDRAAVLLLCMGEENAAGIIKRLSKRTVHTLSDRMAKISNITQADVALILQDFFSCYRTESGVNGASRSYMERALDKAIGRKLARGMLDEIYGGALADDIRRLEWVPEELLARFIEKEHSQMQALLMAFLSPEQASRVLERLPEARHSDILFRIANLREINEHIMEDLRHTVQNCIEYVGEQLGASVNGVEKAAGIINRYNGNKAEVIVKFKEKNAETGEAVEDYMYDFSTLKQQHEDVIAQLLAEIPDELWVVALKGVDPVLLHKILSSLPKRLAQVYRQQIDGLKAQPVSKVEAARAEIMSIIRQLMLDGEIEYRLYDEVTVG
jgi:flagellar motor switch protein FliG